MSTKPTEPDEDEEWFRQQLARLLDERVRAEFASGTLRISPMFMLPDETIVQSENATREQWEEGMGLNVYAALEDAAKGLVVALKYLVARNYYRADEGGDETKKH